MIIKCRDLQTTEKYYVDLSTNNESFIKISLLLRAKGIQNNFFHLKLYDKRLSGVDPFSQKLTVEQKVLIAQEAKNNKFYFIRECFRLPDTGADPSKPGSGSKFILNRANLAYFWARQFNLSVFMVLPRQIGKTWSVLADWTHEYYAYKNANMLHFNKLQTDANDNITRIKQALELLPKYLQHSNTDLLNTEDRKKVKRNEKEIKSRYGTRIVAMASATNKTKADTLARGKTVEKIWFDEHAFILFNEIVYNSAMPAYNTAAKNAKIAGIPHGIIQTTTPGDLCTPHGAFSFKMKNTCIEFDESMYNLPEDELIDIMKNTPDKINMLYIEFQYFQVGKDDEWLEEARKKSTDPISFRREFLLEWINTNGKSPFDVDDVSFIEQISRDKYLNKHEEITINKYFKLKVYATYSGVKPVLISVDVGGGGGKDSSAVVVINPETLKPMAVFKSNLISTYHLKRFLITLMQKVYPNCILTIEKNYLGDAIIEELVESPYRRFLYKEKRVVTEEEMQSGFSTKRKIEKLVYGHRVDSSSRPKMMEMLTSMVQHNKDYLALPELIDEIKMLEWRNNRIDHGVASHDDTIFAYFGGLFVVKYGNGLRGTGIDFNIGLDEDDVLYQSISANLRLLDIAVQRNSLDHNSLQAQMNQVNKFLSTEQDAMTGGEYLELQERREYERLNGVLNEEESISETSRNMMKIISKNLGHSLNNLFDDKKLADDKASTEGQNSRWFLDKYHQ